MVRHDASYGLKTGEESPENIHLVGNLQSLTQLHLFHNKCTSHLVVLKFHCKEQSRKLVLYLEDDLQSHTKITGGRI